jgi:2-dehydro-3-deoxyglucarate aldolase/4-hydroxy-2-oxoheptanedioate aldolase
MADSLKHAHEADDPLVGSWVTVGHPAVAELVASVGFDFVVLDGEHAPSTYETLENMARAVEAAPGETETVVRVADGDPVTLKRTLDIGPDGVLVPMVDTPGDARMIVEGTRYPPAGVRGLGATRRNGYGDDLFEDARRANDELTVLVQLETARAVENARPIAGMDGVDGLFLGPVDLSVSLGVPGEWDDETFIDAVERIVEAAHDAGVCVGTLATDDESRAARLDWDVDYLAATLDVLDLRTGAREALAHARALAQQ